MRFRRQSDQDRVLSWRFVVVMISGFCYFTAMGALLPIVPRYVDKHLGGNDIEVGIAVGALAVGAILLRPLAGRIGDRFGRRVLMVGGALAVGVTALAAGVFESLEWLVGTRFLMGLGEACFFVGATTMATDLAPEERRGEAVSYWSVALWGGLAFGPVLGETLLGASGYDLVWYAAGGLALAASAVALFTKETHVAVPGARGRIIATEAVRPGVILGLTLIGITGFSIFIPLYAPEVGVDDVGALFLVYGVVVLGVRIFGAKLPDRLGPMRAGTIAIGSACVGLMILALWQSTAGIVVATVVVAVGSSFLYPALLMLALRGVPESQRGSVIGTFSAFYDFAGGVAGIVLGGIAAMSSYAGSFAGASILAAVALVLLRGGFGRHDSGTTPAVAEVGTASVEPTSLP